MSLKEMIFSDDFSRYRRGQIREIVAVIISNIKNDPSAITGQFEIARRILNTPSKMLKDPKLNDQINKLLKEDFARLEVEIARQGIMTDE